MGHVSRCLALADELRDRERCTVTFAMRGLETAGGAAVRAAGYALDAVAADVAADYGDELQAITVARDASAIVVDVRDALSRASLDAIRGRGIRIVSIDEATDRRLAADLAFYPPVPQVDEMDWTRFAGRRYTGWEWVLLRREFSGAREFSGPREFSGGPEFSGARAFQASDARSADSLALQESASPAIDVLVTMGGSDPAGMTEFAIAALDLLPMPLAVCVVVGPAFARAEALSSAVARSTHAVRIARAPGSLVPLMRGSRLAVASFGVSAYELAACGVPAVHLCLTDDHARSSSAFDKEGAAVTAGVFGRLTPEELADPVRRLIGRADRRGQMAARATQLVDGRGAERVAALVAAAI
jgi:spore coat polysaccharide biosynthesis predicted glycosyltransferase SpsG